MLPDAASLVPVKAQSPKQLCQYGLTGGGTFQPNPFADDFRQFVLLRQLCPQVFQNGLRGQITVGVMFRIDLCF